MFSLLRYLVDFTGSAEGSKKCFEDEDYENDYEIECFAAWISSWRSCCCYSCYCNSC